MKAVAINHGSDSLSLRSVCTWIMCFAAATYTADCMWMPQTEMTQS